MSDKFHDECGVVGVFGNPEAALLFVRIPNISVMILSEP